jgi:hypothetical protein
MPLYCCLRLEGEGVGELGEVEGGHRGRLGSGYQRLCGLRRLRRLGMKNGGGNGVRRGS